MQWWRWTEGAAAAVLVLMMLALRFDTLKDQPSWSAGRALRRLAPFTLVIPVLFVLALFGPWWLGLVVVIVPGLVLLVLAAAD